MKNMTRVEKKSVASALPQPPVEDASATSSAALSEDAIRSLAYEKWQAAGCPDGDGVEFWLQAESEIATNDGRNE